MQEVSTYIVPIYKGTYENISEAYQSLHKSFYYESKMDMTRQQEREAQPLGVPHDWESLTMTTSKSQPVKSTLP